MKPKTLKVPMLHFSAAFAPVRQPRSPEALAKAESDNAERRKTVTFYSGATVDRYSWENGRYMLTLSTDPKHVRMDRMKSGAPVLDSHSDYTIGDVLGVVEDAQFADGKGTADLRFSKRDEVTPIWNDVVDGIIKNVSVGFMVYKLKDLSKENDKVKSFLAVDWEPMEVSVVPIGADPGAGFSASSQHPEQEKFTEAEIENFSGASAHSQGDPQMEPTIEQLAAAAAEKLAADKLAAEKLSLTTKPAVTPVALDAGAIITAERFRASEIRKIASAVKLTDAFTAPHIAGATSVEQFRELALNELAAQSAAVDTRSNVAVTRDAADNRREGMTNALLHRFQPQTYKLEEKGREYHSMSLLRMAEECLERTGKSTRGMHKMEMVQFALQSVSDFPNILAATANKTLRSGYEAAPQTWRPLALRESIPDFKLKTLLTLGDVSAFQKINDAGEFKRGSMPEGKETYKLATYGEVIGITRAVIINDDLGAFTRVPMLLGRAAAELENTTVWGVVTANPVLQNDSTAVFDTATHKNYLSSGTVISIASLGLRRAAMRQQTGPGGLFMNLAAKYLVVPTALETVSQQFTSPGLYIAQQSNVNPFASTLTPICEPRLDASSATAWYMFADPNVPGAEVLVYAYLSGQEGVFTETRMGFDVDGVEIKARLDFAAAAIDYRGVQKNAGA